jgi:predicted DNA-binding transcriptional regulator AlpA
MALLTPEETARKARLTTATFAKLRCTGGGPPFVKLGSRVFYDERDVDAWIDARKRRCTAEYVRQNRKQRRAG